MILPWSSAGAAGAQVNFASELGDTRTQSTYKANLRALARLLLPAIDA